VRTRWVLATAIGWGALGTAYAGVGVDRLVLSLQATVPCQVPALGVGDAVRAHLWVGAVLTLQSLALLAVWQGRAWALPARAPRPEPPRPAPSSTAATVPFRDVRGDARAGGGGGWGAWALGSVILTVGVTFVCPRVWPLLDPSPRDLLAAADPAPWAPWAQGAQEAPGRADSDPAAPSGALGGTLTVPIWSRLALVQGWGVTWLLAQGLWLGAWIAGMAPLRALGPTAHGGRPRGPREVASQGPGRDGDVGLAGDGGPHPRWRRWGWGVGGVLGTLAIALGALPGPLGGWGTGACVAGVAVALGEGALLARAHAVQAGRTFPGPDSGAPRRSRGAPRG